MTKLDLIKLNYIQQVAASNIVLEIGRERSFGLKGEDLSELYSRVKEVQSLFYYESLKNDADLKVLTQASLKLSHLLSRFMPVGVVEITKSEIVPIGKVKIPPTKPVTIYYGWSDTNALPTIEEIKSSNSFVVGHNVNYIIPFQQVQDWKYLWFWEPLTEPIKTDWEEPGNPLNKGQIGGATNLFRTPKEIGDGRWFITAYLTIADAPLLFKSGGEIIPDVPDPVWTIAEPPVLVGNDTTNILTATQVDYPNDIVYTTDGINWVLYTAPIVVGDNDRPVGYWKFKVREIPASYVHESSIVDSPEFHKVPPIIQYTLTVNVQGTTGATIYVNGSAIVGNTITVPAGTVLTNIVAIKSGYTMEPASYPSVTMDADKTLGFVATVVPVFRTLTVIVNGLLEPYEILIDGVPQPSNILTFPDGTVLNDISIQVDNYDILPVVIGEIIMDQNRTALFNATLVKRLLTIDTGGITGVDVYVDEVLYTGDFQFDHGTVLNNISLHKAGYTFAPTNVPETIMDANKTLSFVGTPVVVRTLTIDVQGTTGYTLTIDGQQKTGTTFQYNDGTVVNDVKVTKSGWRFAPASYPSTTMDGDKTLSFVAELIPIYTLDFNVTGTTDYEVRIDGVLQPSGQLSFPDGTVLVDIMLSKIGWKFNPLKVNTLIMDSNKTLDFIATEDFTQLNYLPGFTAYNPKERYARLGQGGQSAITEIEPGKWQASTHRIDFIGYIRVPIGGEVAQKVKTGLEVNIVYLNPVLPWSDDANKEDYNITGYSAGAVGKDSFYGNGIDNKLEIRDWTDDGFHASTPIPTGDWILFRRESWDLMNIYYTNGVTEQLIYSMPFDGFNGSAVDFMYLKHTIWKDGSNDGWLNYPQVRGCFHELDNTWPPSIVYDDDANLITANHDTLPITEILYSENDGLWLQYTGPINVGNIDRPFGYYKFKIKAATGRDESPWVQSAKFTASTIPEGKQNLVFQNLENLIYNSVNNTYSIEDTSGSNNGGSGYNSQIILPINGSAAIYWNQDTINESRINLGFDSESTPRSGNLDISAQLNKWFNNAIVAVLRSDGIDVNVGDMSPNIEYRLVCRNNELSREWKIESSTDDWLSGIVLYTYIEALNTVTLYPKMVLQSWNLTTISGLKIEYYADENIPELLLPPSIIVNAFQGNLTTTSFEVNSKTSSVNTAVLKVYSDTNRANLVYTSPVSNTDTDNVLKLSGIGLQPNTKYYWTIVLGNSNEFIGEIKTLPDGASSYKILVSGCASGTNGQGGSVSSDIGVSNKSTFEGILNLHSDALMFMHSGDMHYRNISANDESKFLGAYDDVLRQPRQQSLYRSMGLTYIFDDHDYGDNDSDASSPSRPAAISAYKKRIPHYTLPFTGPTDPICHTFVIGRVRYINLDTRSQRVEPTTLLGATQKQWLKDTLLSATEPVICINVGVSWNSGGGNGWTAAPSERAELITFFTDNNLIDRLFVTCGDTHMLGIDNGTNSGGFPVFQLASIDSPPSDKGGIYSEGKYSAATGNYGVIKITDTGGTDITVTCEACNYSSGQQTKQIVYSKVYSSVPLTPLNPLTGFSFIDLPTSDYIDLGNQVYSPLSPDADLLLPQTIDADGSIAVKFTGDGGSVENKIYLMELNSLSTDNTYYVLRINNDTITLRSQFETSANRVNMDITSYYSVGDYVVLTRTGSTYSLGKSTDGILVQPISFAVDPQLTSNLKYIKIACSNPITELQIKN